MKTTSSRFPTSATLTSRFGVGLASASLASACSGYYPLGQSDTDHLDGDSVTNAPVGDAQVDAVLASPEVTFVEEFFVGGYVVPLGDLDADGREEVAVTLWEPTTDVGYVHLRYGGPRPRDGEEAFAFDEGGARLTWRTGFFSRVMAAAAGDVDGDGYADVLIHTNNCGVAVRRGGAFLIYGRPERLEGVHALETVADAHFVPPPLPTGADLSGPCADPISPGGTGDLDGDGFDDLVIHDRPYPSDAPPFSGPEESLYLFYGREQRFSGELPIATADAHLQATHQHIAAAVGDINSDGLADVLVSAPREGGSFLLSGRNERWSGSLTLASSSTFLAGADRATADQPRGDLDGDGVSDILLTDANDTIHLFYGAPGLFENGIDFSAADASVQKTEHTGFVLPIGDRDGDGDDELLAKFRVPSDSPTDLGSDVALSSGSRQRRSGSFSFPESEVVARTPRGRYYPFEELQHLDSVFPGGDLDGDGAAEVFSVSRYGGQVGAQVHIHYGTPAGQTVPTAPVR